MPVICMLRKLKQEDQESETSLSYAGSSRSVRAPF